MDCGAFFCALNRAAKFAERFLWDVKVPIILIGITKIGRYRAIFGRCVDFSWKQVYYDAVSIIRKD